MGIYFKKISAFLILALFLNAQINCYAQISGRIEKKHESYP